jgi:hypothetical protein
VIRGSSGAVVATYNDHVTKVDTATERTRLQGEWLMKHQSVIFPAVLELLPGGYAMERLSSAPIWALDHMELLHYMLDGLAKRVWSHEPVVRYDVDTTLRRVRQIADRYVLDDAYDILSEVATELDWDDLAACLTHGDATFDNVMFRGEQLVMIDPIPATLTVGVPDLWSADMGHILRSVIGFERVRYRDDNQHLRVTAKQFRFHIDDDQEWTATVFWCAVHLLRTLPYAPNDDVREGLGGLVRDAIGLL